MQLRNSEEEREIAQGKVEDLEELNYHLLQQNREAKAEQQLKLLNQAGDHTSRLDSAGNRGGSGGAESKSADIRDRREQARAAAVTLSRLTVEDWVTLGDEDVQLVQSEWEAASVKMKIARDNLRAHAESLRQQQAEAMDEDSRQNALCCICRESPKTILLLPCKHLCVCEECCFSLMATPRTKCPVCRGGVVDSLRVYA